MDELPAAHLHRARHHERIAAGGGHVEQHFHDSARTAVLGLPNHWRDEQLPLPSRAREHGARLAELGLLSCPLVGRSIKFCAEFENRLPATPRVESGRGHFSLSRLKRFTKTTQGRIDSEEP